MKHEWTFKFKGWDIDIDLTMIGFGVGIVFANRSAYLCLPFVLITREGRFLGTSPGAGQSNTR